MQLYWNFRLCCFYFFSKFCASKSGVRLIYGCGLYTDVYGIRKVCLNLTVEKSKNGTQSKLHCTKDNQEHLSYAGGLTWMSSLFSQTFQRYLWSCVMLPLKVLRDELSWKRLVINFLCMRSRLEAHILVMPEWCPKLLAFIVCREVVSFICQLREDKCFMEVSVLAILSPCTLEDWSCWMLGWYCIIFVHFVAGFELGFNTLYQCVSLG